MIMVTKTNDHYDIKTTLRQPGVYLDQDSLADIARTDTRRRHFLSTFGKKGTLLFSWTNAFDLSGPQGDSAAKIRDLLRGVGPHWVPLEMNPWKVVKKETGQEPSNGTPCVSESFLRAYYPHVHGGPLDLATVVDLIQKDRAAVQAEIRTLKTRTDAMVEKWRAQYRKDETRLDQVLPPETWDPNRPVAFLLRELERQVTREAKAFVWMPNDGVDFVHAAVAAACADFLVLDKQWKRRVLAVAPPRRYRWIYYRTELDEFLEAFEHAVVATC
jgi:hypothetical protein